MMLPSTTIRSLVGIAPRRERISRDAQWHVARLPACFGCEGSVWDLRVSCDMQQHESGKWQAGFRCDN